MIKKILLILYTILILMIPYDLNYYGITYPKVLLVYSTIVTIYLILSKNINLNLFKNKTLKYITIGFGIFLLIVAISVVTNTIIDKKIIISNFFETFRVLQYYLIILNYYVLLKDNTKKFKISFIIILIFNILLSFFQFHNLFGLNELYVKYIASTQYETLVNGYKFPRAVGLAGNPNVLGFLFSLSAIYIMDLILKEPKKWYYYSLYLFLVIGIFLTASRTSYVSLILGSGLVIILRFFKLNKKSIFKLLEVGTIYILLQVLLLLVLPNSYTWRIKELVNLDNVTSWQKRVESNKDFVESLYDEDNINNDSLDKNNEVVDNNNKFDENNNFVDTDINIENNKSSSNKIYTFIIGSGPDKLKQKNKGHFDNEWFKLFFNYGVLGVVSFIFMLIFPLFSLKINKKFNYVLYGGLLLSNFVYMIAAASYHCYLLFNLLCILFAISIINEKKNVR